MNALRAFGIGYLFGCFNPAAIIAKIKHIDLRKEGTGNLGATNTTLVLGGGAGICVLLADIFKSMLSAALTRKLFPTLLYAGLIAGIGCIVGHCFPVFMHFHGGKGVAAFAGMVLMYNPWFAVPIVVLGTALILILDVGLAAPMFASFLFPILVFFERYDWIEVALAALAGLILVFTHRDNIKRAIENRNVISVYEFLRRFRLTDKKSDE